MSAWLELVSTARSSLSSKDLTPIYSQRLEFELSEIVKQGAEAYWLGLWTDKKQFSINPNSLVLPWLLGMVTDDPLPTRKEPLLCSARASDVLAFKKQHGFVPSDITKDSDMPDIDLDCLKEARAALKDYAAAKYNANVNDGYGTVCSVGTLQTFKFKSAIVDVALALGCFEDRYAVESITSVWPIDVDGLKEGGKAICKGMVRDSNTGIEKECNFSHAEIKCPKCGSEETDGITLSRLISEQSLVADFNQKYPEVVHYASALIGRVRNLGMHAGAIIITDRPLYGNIPLARNKADGQWVSMWTEGRETQLSKFGYVKIDILGLKTLSIIVKCCKLIEENRGISFGHNFDGWDDADPIARRRGWYYDGNGTKRAIDLDDEHVLRLANKQHTDGIFQFDTDLAKSILANGVRCFEDLLLMNAMGHPGPMQCIPEAMQNRDDKAGIWKRRLTDINPILFEILKDTYGVICWQESLQALWQQLAGFTAPEAQAARKAVAKKRGHQLLAIEKRWIDGATKSIGEKAAVELWNNMTSFARYAFCKAHGVSYCLVAHTCLWLKAHFAPEWWAATMSECHPDKLVRFMSVARAEAWTPTEITYSGKYKPKVASQSVKFATININNLTTDYTVTGDNINQGLIGIKGIGKKAAALYAGRSKHKTIEDFIGSGDNERRNKTVMERFIKLEAFKQFPGHENALALWNWYQYKYCSGKEITQLKNEIRAKLKESSGWSDAAIAQERQRQAAEYKKAYPKRNKIPPKIAGWKPTIDDSREAVMALFPEDFQLHEKLEFQKKFLGYYIDSPLDLYDISGGCTIAQAKIAGSDGDLVKIEVIIEDANEAITKTGKPFLKLIVSDGIQKALVMIWNNELRIQDLATITPGNGVSLRVHYDPARNNFSLGRAETAVKLMPRGYICNS